MLACLLSGPSMPQLGAAGRLPTYANAHWRKSRASRRPAMYGAVQSAGLSCYQAQRSAANPRHVTDCDVRNLSNQEFFEFLSNLKPSARSVDRFLLAAQMP